MIQALDLGDEVVLLDFDPSLFGSLDGDISHIVSVLHVPKGTSQTGADEAALNILRGNPQEEYVQFLRTIAHPKVVLPEKSDDAE